MNPYRLTDKIRFTIVPVQKKARLIIFRGDTELVCRKETFSNLAKFIKGPDTTIFKGRLQLSKTDQDISIVIKGQIAGSISVDEFSSIVNTCR
jgi:hypothetical protein